MTAPKPLPPRQRLAAAGKWPVVGQRECLPWSSPWKVSISGLVSEPQSYTLDDLQSGIMDEMKTDHLVDIHCVTRWSKLAMTFQGVPLYSLLKKVRPHANARYVSFVSHTENRHSTSLPLADIQTLNPILAWSQNGKAISAEHGGPLRVITPSRYFYKSLKWVVEIQLLEEDALGFWEAESGYHNHADYEQEERYISGSRSTAETEAILKRRDWCDEHFLSLQASSAELTNLEATKAILRNADFQNANLSGANFTDANLSNANFRGACLRNVSFHGADLEGADFKGANLDDADLTNASLFGATFD